VRSIVVFTRFDGSVFSTRRMPRAHAISMGLLRPAEPQYWERQTQELAERFGCPAWVDRAAVGKQCWVILTREEICQHPNDLDVKPECPCVSLRAGGLC